MNQSTGMVSSYARNILDAKDVVNYQEPWILPDGNSKSVKIRPVSQYHNADDLFRVYPNPANEYFIVEYSDGPFDEVLFELVDAGGRVVRIVVLERGMEYHVFSVKDLPGGVYFVILRMNGKIVGTSRIIII
jgi:hypothetical protein